MVVGILGGAWAGSGALVPSRFHLFLFVKADDGIHIPKICFMCFSVSHLLWYHGVVSWVAVTLFVRGELMTLLVRGELLTPLVRGELFTSS